MPFLLGDEELLGEEELLGDDELLGEFILGAARRRRGRRPQRGGMQVRRRNPVLRTLAARARGGNNQGREWVLPFTGTQTLTATVTTTTLTANPQKGFVGRRLTIDLGRVGTTAATALVQVTQIAVGTDPQQAALGSYPASMFAFNAVGNNMSFDLGRPGIAMTLGLSQSGLTMTDTIVVSAGLIGSSTPDAV
jgi:hypothetical protein